MNIVIQTINFEADERLLAFIREKLTKLSQFFDSILDVQVFLRLEKNTELGNKLMEVKLNVPTDTLVVSQRNRTFESATDGCLEQLARLVKRHKEKVRGY